MKNKPRNATIGSIAESVNNNLRKRTRENMQEQNSNNKFECDKCGWKFRTPARLKRHMFDKKFSCVKEFKCDECPESFNTKRAINRHKYVHQKEFHFNCDNCGKKFKHPDAKHCHQKKCNPTAFSPDEEDGENQKENQDNEEIISEEDSFEDEEFEMKSDSSDSDVDFEPELKKKKPNKAKRTTPKRFECEKCGGTFASKASLIWHLNERVKPCVPSKTSTKSFEGFKSDDWNEELPKSPKENNRKRKRKNKARKTRNSQKETKSLKSNQTKFKCGKCGAVFANNSNLIRHLENRAIPCDFVKQFKCDECDKSFSSETYLDHKYAHKEEFRFSCELCGVKFKQKFFLKNHGRKCKPTFIYSEKDTKKDSEDRDEGNQDFLSDEESIEIVEVQMDSDFADSGIGFKIPEVPENNNQNAKKALPKSPKENSRNRKRRNLKIKARQVINRVMHYHFNEKNADGSITERWLPIFEVEDFDDVLEFEKFMAKVEFGSEEDNYKPENDYFFC